MSELISGGLRIVGSNFNNVKMSHSGIRFEDGSGYDVKSETVLATRASTFKLYRKVRYWIFWERWELIADIKEGNGTAHVNFRQI